MKKNILLLLVLIFSFESFSQQYEYKIITSVESIVPNGTGRSRIVVADEEKNYQDYTISQTAGTKTRNKSSRKEIRVKNFTETKLLNFFNIAGIRFQNIAANDALITSKINDMVSNGWELQFVVTGVESWGSKDDRNGLFITRYIFKKQK